MPRIFMATVTTWAAAQERITAGALLIGTLFVIGAGAALADPFRVITLPLAEGLVQVRDEAGTAVLTLQRARHGNDRFRLELAGGDVRLRPAGPVPPSVSRPDGILPDGDVASGQRNIARAWLAGASRRYGHAVLGDAVEATELVAVDRTGRELRYRLSPDSVFEDRLVRLADVTGDGDDELVVVRAYLDAGAAVAVFKAVDDDLRLLAEAAAIGQPYRWLNPVGVADFDGDGAAEIAVVITPHIGGILTLYALRGAALVPEHAVAGFSNHALGSRELGLSAHGRLLGDPQPVLAVPSADRRALRLVSFAGGKFSELQRIAHASAIVTAIVAADLDGNGTPELVYGLGDDTLVVVRGG